MKSYNKLILTLIVALCGFGVANSQLRFGVKGGLNLNSLHFNDAATTFGDENKCGYTLGVMTEFPDSPYRTMLRPLSHVHKDERRAYRRPKGDEHRQRFP